MPPHLALDRYFTLIAHLNLENKLFLKMLDFYLHFIKFIREVDSHTQVVPVILNSLSVMEMSNQVQVN